MIPFPSDWKQQKQKYRNVFFVSKIPTNFMVIDEHKSYIYIYIYINLTYIHFAGKHHVRPPEKAQLPSSTLTRLCSPRLRRFSKTRAKPTCRDLRRGRLYRRRHPSGAKGLSSAGGSTPISGVDSWQHTIFELSFCIFLSLC